MSKLQNFFAVIYITINTYLKVLTEITTKKVLLHWPPSVFVAIISIFCHFREHSLQQMKQMGNHGRNHHVLGSGDNVVKLFHSSLQGQLNKLECLCLESLGGGLVLLLSKVSKL